MQRFIRLALSLFSMTLVGQAMAGQASVLRVAFSGDEKPLHYHEGNGFSGFEADLAKLLADKLGKKVEHVDLESLGRGSFEALDMDLADVSINTLTVSDNAPPSVAFTEPYLAVPYRFAHVQGKKPEKLETLSGKIAISDSAGNELALQAAPNTTLVPCKSLKEAVVMVMRGEAELLAAGVYQLAEAVKDTKLATRLVPSISAHD